MKKSLLMIGNSYTYYNNMPEGILTPLLEEAGWEVELCSLTKGSQHLIDSANPEDVLGAKVDAALKEKAFDHAVIQDQSAVTVLHPEKYKDGVRAILAKLRENGAKVLMYSTWGRKEGCPYLEEHGLSYEGMMEGLIRGQGEMAKEEGIPAAFVGVGFRLMAAAAPEIELYRDDGSHPNVNGSYLAAVCLASHLTGKDPESFSFRGEVEEDVAKKLRLAAKIAVNFQL